jgi:hypothetical protein
VTSPPGCYRLVPDLRIRPVPELEKCIVFTPADPQLFTLNTTAWLILELCEGKTAAELEEAFCSLLESRLARDTAETQLKEGLDMLLASRIIHLEEPHAPSDAAKSLRSRPRRRPVAMRRRSRKEEKHQ